ncbi:MAG TPA: DUF896 domain-containing protein [Bacillota bacterium]|jgi:uncharacterized protein YnzC (UPF0291/DUF896 family)|nr:DUF896 domain-containing protein [Peptococcaceae bacterium MAG4]NLW37108.1 DUF896 domain-containing protein [Peptococcaceae bacterium]HPU35431.1 DUF896 domain-containing protein [Bacillota bacterium]HPZ44141.1 DUF896 domain-containing protein [Bacillota bacterium]HQD76907.1 DUF896 domain-containing protein [Bacillota bacterium]
MNDLVARINWLARKKREQGLTPQEEKEQRELRARYLKYIRNQLVDALESAGFKPKGKKEETCSCGHCAPRAEKQGVPCSAGDISRGSGDVIH